MLEIDFDKDYDAHLFSMSSEDFDLFCYLRGKEFSLDRMKLFQLGIREQLER